MSDQNVFKEQESNPQETPEQQPASTDVFKDHLTQIKNERGEPKYNSVEDALKGAAHAQTYIQELTAKLEKLESESSGYKSELEKRQSVEETLARLTASQSQEKEVTASAQGLDEDKARQIFQQELTASQQATLKEQNVKSVNETLIKQFGEKAGDQVHAKAKELGLTVQRLQEMSQESPKAVLHLFNLNQSSKSSSTSYGGQRVPSEYAPKENVLERPTKSLLRGASTADKMEYFKKVKAGVYQRNGVTE